MDLRPVWFRDKKEAEEQGDQARLRLGLISEEVAGGPLDVLADYNEEGKPEAVYYAKLSVALLSVVQQQVKRIDKLEETIKTLTA